MTPSNRNQDVELRVALPGGEESLVTIDREVWERLRETAADTDDTVGTKLSEILERSLEKQ